MKVVNDSDMRSSIARSAGNRMDAVLDAVAKHVPAKDATSTEVTAEGLKLKFRLDTGGWVLDHLVFHRLPD